MGASHQKFHNTMGVSLIRVSTKEFECIGARPPLDHPHVFLTMGQGDHVSCPYCATQYVYDKTLSPKACFPEDAGLE